MYHVYSLNTMNIADTALDEIVQLMVQQARISSRRRPDRWKLEVHNDNVCIRFLHKYDCNDFLSVFETECDDFLGRHDLMFSAVYRSAKAYDRAERDLLPIRARQRR